MKQRFLLKSIIDEFLIGRVRLYGIVLMLELKRAFRICGTVFMMCPNELLCNELIACIL